MAAFTELTAPDAEKMLQDLARSGNDVGTHIKALERIPTGLTNSIYRLDTDKRHMVVTIFEPRFSEALTTTQEEIRALHQCCADAGLPAPALIGPPLVLHGKPVQVAEYIDAQPLRHISVEQARQVGAVLAQIHMAAQHLPLFKSKPRGSGAVALAEVEGMLRRTTTKGDIRGEVRFFGSLASLSVGRLGAAYKEKQKLPGHIIHGDINPGNLLFDSKGTLAGIIDFEKCRNGVFIEDIGYALFSYALIKDVPRGTSVRYRFDTDIARALLHGYHAVRPLTHDEIRFLPHELADRSRFEVAVAEKARQVGRTDFTTFPDIESRVAALKSIHEVAFMDMVEPVHGVERVRR